MFGIGFLFPAKRIKEPTKDPYLSPWSYVVGGQQWEHLCFIPRLKLIGVVIVLCTVFGGVALSLEHHVT